MAGLYPDVPSHRIAYDRDGSVGVRIDNGVASQLLASVLTIMNNESTNEALRTDAQATGPDIALLFSEKHDLRGYFVALVSNGDFNAVASNLRVSTDTTNGVDGTWTTITSGDLPNQGLGQVTPLYRSQINALNSNGIKGIKFKAPNGGLNNFRSVAVFHVYGALTSGQGPNRLRFWHPTNAAEVGGAYFDWGDTPRNALITRSFRIHNPSARTAHGIVLTREALTSGSPDLVSEHDFSLDGSTFSTSLNIGDLAPGATSAVITLRRNVASNSPLSVWAARLVASASSWS